MNASRPRILVIEDNPVNMELVRDLLEAMDLGVQEATSAEVGVPMAIEDPPDLILLDIRLPGMDGLGAVKLLKENPRTGSVPTVALTAQAMKGDEEAALGAGFDDYITKPIDIRTFREMVGRHVPRVRSGG